MSLRLGPAGAGASLGEANRYRNPNSATVALSTKNVKPAVVICPVAVQTRSAQPGPDTLSITYKDPTGESASGRVEATLFCVNQQTGAIQQVATVTSDFSTGTGIKLQSFDGIDPESFDFDTTCYYLRVVVDRSTARAAGGQMNPLSHLSLGGLDPPTQTFKSTNR